MKEFTFPKVYWGADKSTEVMFEPGNEIPDESLVTSCFAFPIIREPVLSLVMAKPERGWGLPGGHLELGETPEECARREVYEETAVKLGDLSLIGWWKTKKIFSSKYNEKYPEEAYQLLYIADVVSTEEFLPKHEVQERAFVAIDNASELHKNSEDFEAILKFAKTFL